MHPFLMSISNFCYAEMVKKINRSEKYLVFLFLISIVGFSVSGASTAILYMFGEELISIVFGAEWTGASSYAFWFSASMISDFVLFPIYSSLSNIRGYQKYLLKVDILVAIFSFFIVYSCLTHDLDLLDFIIYSSILLVFSNFFKFTVVVSLEVLSDKVKKNSKVSYG
ncbi:MAG: hypothetical protein IE909_15355 [Campylobacterales bacterium]|nr:hypothetical protein [Campylobacterales bacterium]